MKSELLKFKKNGYFFNENIPVPGKFIDFRNRGKINNRDIISLFNKLNSFIQFSRSTTKNISLVTKKFI